jgi:outer membrane lipoprotein-sorting protein
MPHLNIPERALRKARIIALAAVVFPATSFAQSPAPQQDQGTAQAAPATGWTTDTTPATGTPSTSTPATAAPAEDTQPLDARPPIVLTQEQIALLGRINAYLNTLVNVEGRFVQTDHRNEETRGKFYVHRPGKLRFDYSAPSRLRIVSDGEYLSIEDHDLKTVDKFPLDATPIQLLLGKDVDLTRDAIILDMRQDEHAVVVTLRDRTGTAAGQLQLYFKRPELELYEWVITDAQGLDTRIQLADLLLGKEKSEGFFESSNIELERLNAN